VNRLLLLGFMMFFVSSVSGNQQFETFARHMEREHGFDRSEIHVLLKGTEPLQDVLQMFRRPSTDKSFDEFERWFINERRINNGVMFLIEHHDLLERAERVYGVPAPMIVSFLGIETSYGTNIGKHKVVESLITLGFYGHRRQEYFRYELEHFLVTARELNWDRNQIVGSFAGAIGIPQFMPSNIRKLAVDFDGDGQIDLIGNKADAIGSVGNYLQQAGWRRGEPVATRIKITDKRGGSFVLRTLPGPDPVRFRIEHNYKVIKRYNPSDNYAMTIFILAEKIKERRKGEN